MKRTQQLKKAKQILLTGGIVLSCLVTTASAKSLTQAEASAYLPFYSAQKMGLITFPGYKLTSSQLSWLPQDKQPIMHIGYHRAVPFIDRGLTLHFSLVVRHSPTPQTVGANYRCQSGYQQVEFQHPQWGPYVLCTKESLAKAHASGSNQTPVPHTVAFVRPRTGNKMPHISLNLHGFKQEILPLLSALHSYASEP